jgi:hypothetical protein
MKTYIAPALVEKGAGVFVTKDQAVVTKMLDPLDPPNTWYLAAGGVGFQL